MVVRRMAVRPLDGRFSAAEHAKAGGEVGFANVLQINGYCESSLTEPVCSAGGSGGRTRGQKRSALACRNSSDGGAFLCRRNLAR